MMKLKCLEEKKLLFTHCLPPHKKINNCLCKKLFSPLPLYIFSLEVVALFYR